MRAINAWISDQDYIGEGVSNSFNLGRISQDGRLRWHLLLLHSMRQGRVLVHAIGYHFLIRKLLHDLDDKRRSFCPLTIVETDHRKLAMGRQLGWFLKTVGAASGVVSALTTVLAAVVTKGSPPPSSSLTRVALIRWVDDASLGGNGG
jgi:hypothetical protein